MYTLYYAPGAASFAVHWMLIELAVPHQLRKMDLEAGEHRQPWYLKLNPNGYVPTLIVDGAPLYECAALLMLLAERHPEAGLAPPVASPERGLYLSWMFHLSNTLQAAYRDWFYPDQLAGPVCVEAVKAGARARIESCFDRIAAQLGSGGPGLVGDRIGAVDFLATMLMRWSRNMPKPATESAVLANYVRGMKARPSFKTLYAREGLSDWA
ncbi:MAG: glutathione S-transferase family protein [Steroidobacteraceae bacterium]